MTEENHCLQIKEHKEHIRDQASHKFFRGELSGSKCFKVRHSKNTKPDQDTPKPKEEPKSDLGKKARKQRENLHDRIRGKNSKKTKTPTEPRP